MWCLLFVHYDLHCWSSFDSNGIPEVWVLVKHMQWQPKHNFKHSLCPTGKTRRGHLVSYEFNLRLQWKRDSRPSVHRANFYTLISIPKSGRLRTNVSVMDVHKWQTQHRAVPSRTRTKRTWKFNRWASRRNAWWLNDSFQESQCPPSSIRSKPHWHA